MKNHTFLYILSIGATIIATGLLVICLLFLNKQNFLIQKVDELSGQLVSLATVTEPDKAQWIENISPGMNHFHSSAFGHFDYPSEWGEPLAQRINFANGLYNGNKWTLRFNGLGPMGDWVLMEAYLHAPSANIYFPFDTSINSAANVPGMASAAFTQGNTASQACSSYKELHKLNGGCQKFSGVIFFISDEERSESIWFVTSPVRLDTTQQADYPGVVIHSSTNHNKEIRTLLKGLRAQGTT